MNSEEVPESWDCISLLDLKLDISDGNYSSEYPTQKEFVQSGIPFLRANNIGSRWIDSKGMVFIGAQKHEQLKKGHLKKNDILVSTRGEIGSIKRNGVSYLHGNGCCS